QPGEFTRMFQAPKAEEVTPGTLELPVPSILPAKPGSPMGPAAGSFPAGPAPLSPSPQSAPPGSPGPGEFTRLMQATTPPRLPPPEPPKPQPSGPGEFRRFMQVPSGPMPQTPILQQPLRPLAPGSASGSPIGEFTQVFGKADIPQPAPPSAPA